MLGSYRLLLLLLSRRNKQIFYGWRRENARNAVLNRVVQHTPYVARLVYMRGGVYVGHAICSLPSNDIPPR